MKLGGEGLCSMATLQPFIKWKQKSWKEEIECLRSQIVTLKNNPDEMEEAASSKRGKHTKYLPYVFTQEGVAALSGVLRSPIAIQMNISIMRAFVALRQMITGYQELLKRIEELEESTDA